jgi:uncharacterized membrane protein (DUF2068 family)
MRLSNALRSIALYEAGKGALVLLTGLGLLSLLHHDVQHFAARLLLHLHLNPAARYPHIFLDAASQLTEPRMLLLATGAAAYSTVRFVEAYGLWWGRRWAEWFAALSGGIYIPFELYELQTRITLLSLGALLINMAIVVFMLYCMIQRRNSKETNWP